MGSKGSIFLTYCIQIYIFCALCSFQIILTSLFKYILISFGMDKTEVNSTLYSCYFAIPLAVFVLFPLSSLNNVAAFRYVSLFSLVSLTYIMIIFVVETPTYYNYFKTIAFAEPYYIDWNLFPGFAMVCFSYGCQLQLLPIQRELKNPNLPRINKVINRSTIIVLFFFSAIGVSGFMSQLSEINPVSVERETPDGNISITTIIAAICIGLCIMAAFPVNVLPFKQSFFHQILKRETYSPRQNLIFSGVVITCTTIISVVFPSITSVIGLAGGLIGIQ